MDIKFIRENRELVKDNEKKRFDDPYRVDTVLELDQQWRQEKYKIDLLRGFANKLSKKFRNAPKGIQIIINSDNIFFKFL